MSAGFPLFILPGPVVLPGQATTTYTGTPAPGTVTYRHFPPPLTAFIFDSKSEGNLSVTTNV